MTICENLQTIGARIRAAEQTYGQVTNHVQLLAVSKYHPTSAIKTAYDAGQRIFGENYVQEMDEKAQALPDDIEWHFIGPIQSNKTKTIAQLATWVHAVDRFKIAKRLSEQKPENREPINICLQVNISEESTKSGLRPEEILPLAQQIKELTGIRLRGLMAIPAPEANFEKQRKTFSKVKALQQELIQAGFELDTLSMGMTGDMEAAIAEGATIVRIGTAIFGSREY